MLSERTHQEDLHEVSARIGFLEPSALGYAIEKLAALAQLHDHVDLLLMHIDLHRIGWRRLDQTLRSLPQTINGGGATGRRLGSGSISALSHLHPNELHNVRAVQPRQCHHFLA